MLRDLIIYCRGSRVMLGKEYSQKVLHEQKPHFNLFGKGNKRIENSVRLPLLSDYLLNRYKNKYPIYYARGANMSFWKKDIFDINGYNESYEGWGHEDSDLTLRMMNNGVKKSVIKFAAIVYHLYHAENIRPDLELKKQINNGANPEGPSYLDRKRVESIFKRLKEK
jgi:hypothetical protein